MRTLVPVHVTLALASGDHKANEDVNNNEEQHWMRCGGLLSLSSAMFMSISIRGTVARSQQHYTIRAVKWTS